MSENKTTMQRYSFVVLTFLTVFYLVFPGLLESVSDGIKKFHENQPIAAVIVWVNLWLCSVYFLYSQSIREYFKAESIKALLLKICQSLASLKFTVFLLGISLLLVFVGTLAQVELGIWDVVDQYFRCAFARVKFAYFIRGEASESIQRLHYFLPGGYTLGVLFLVNLLCAHSLKFKITKEKTKLVIGSIITLVGLGLIFWAVRDGIISEDIPSAYVDSYKRVLYRLLTGLISTLVLLIGCWFLFNKRAGIVVLHFGIILLLFSELITGVFAKEGIMRISEGDYAAYIDLSRTYELAITDPDAGKTIEKSYLIPEELLKAKDVWHPLDSLGTEFKVNRWYNNSEIDSRKNDDSSFSGLGKSFEITEKPIVSGVENREVNLPACEVEFRDKSGKLVGKYIFSLRMYLEQNSKFEQEVTIGDKVFKMMFRNKRDYIKSLGAKNPTKIKLLDFRHDQYLGTSVAKNFSSWVELIDEEKEIDRKVLISMNNPLRYAGRTFYQSSFTPDESGTVLQVVSNPGWMLPYLCCVIVGVGMLFQFIITLIAFMSRRLS